MSLPNTEPQLPPLIKASRPGRTIRIVQFGDGVFLRGFFDWMVHTANKTLDADLGVALVQPRRGDSVERLMAGGGAYTLIQQGLKDGQPHQEREIIDCFEMGLNTHQDPEAFRELARRPEVEVLVSNTTEAGLRVHPGDAALGLEDRAKAESFPGKVLWFLYERFLDNDASARPLLVLPLELVEDNGRVLQQLVTGLADGWNMPPEFRAWLDNTVQFVDTLVDRIVPGRPPKETASLESALGYSDPNLVVSELYHSFLVRGPQRIHDVLPFDRCGVNFHVVDDLKAARDAKVSILNGAHTAMTPIGLLAGIRTVGDAVEDARLSEFITVLLEQSILPVLSIPLSEAQEFASAVMERFRNPFIEHQLESISLNHTSKIRSRLSPLLQRIWNREKEEGATVDDSPLALVIAATLMLARAEGQAFRDDPDAVEAYERLWKQHARSELSIHDLVSEALNSTTLLNLPNHPRRFAESVSGYLEIMMSSDVFAAVEQSVTPRV